MASTSAAASTATASNAQPSTSTGASVNSHAHTTPIIATGDWTKNLVQLAKTAELKKHALTLQLHTAHILSAHASLEQKNKAIQDLKEQKNKLESERNRLLNALREVNEDRDKADLLEASLSKECQDLNAKIKVISDGDYAIAKRDVDRLRQELGQPPLPSLKEILEEKGIAYLKDRMKAGDKRAAADGAEGQPGKRPRGRPRGSKNKKPVAAANTQPAPSGAPGPST
ncbi:hypothetical protein GLOTRDRAFT_71619 [Gloeophyllum trabeum ATCC 11539]|uniref:Uncharacterized protein n=1 Tax=Gloeophyllum trabeum (strain ATCC 11539 / FP-39264 / Madison 617) TaxID=670483 RepID=S7QD21_GLOTA|nr:uncharacterized protein GLOTRDRAFT_71619 [Gloeophyllum trabeum ATCC 11539]EPQ57761.1 hypothetical protein GLOTRDRAFT_71619 [Gloeophyllum trabeum ATCC 11539]